jgi:ribonuclease D
MAIVRLAARLSGSPSQDSYALLPAVSHTSIQSPAQLDPLCGQLARADRVAIDTEFVSEDTYRPELCLVQVAIDGELAVIDPFRAQDLASFWEALAEGEHATIVHAAREEVNFSLASCGRPPANLFDTQIAAGFCSTEFPSSYASVVTKFLDQSPGKGEQRTDWRRRPLSDHQIEYALEDVRYLLPLHEKLQQSLKKLNRLDWLAAEMADWLEEVRDARTRERWRKVSGIGSLSGRSLSIVRELWRWREGEAERRDVPPRRVLRDDLIVELAKRKSDSPERIRAIRGLQRNAKSQWIQQLAECIRRGLEAPLDQGGKRPREAMPSQLNLLGQFLSPALASICRSAGVATSLAGTASDVRDLIAYRLEFGNASAEEPPVLARGWRAELVGHLIEDLLAGKKSIRIEDPESEHPLAFDGVQKRGHSTLSEK